MKGIVLSGSLALIVCGCGTNSANAPATATAPPIGSWRGSVVMLNLGSDGRVSYKSQGGAEFAGKWEWLPTTQGGGVLVLSSAAPGSAGQLKFPVTWLNKNALQLCDSNDHCDTLSRQ